MSNQLQVVSSEEIQYNFDHFNQIRNTYELKVIDRNAKYPKHLLIQAWKWFCDEAKVLHIDTSYYKYVEITKWDCTWQVDFYDNEQVDGRHFSLYEIYYDSRNKQILQAKFGIG